MIVTSVLARSARRALRAHFDAWEPGRLSVCWPDGQEERFGTGEPALSLAVRRDDALARLATRSDVGAGESYVDGGWEVDDLPRFLAGLLPRLGAGGASVLQRLVRLGGDLQHRLRRNSRRGSRRNVQAHYDLSNRFFQLFLDETMTYSSAVFDHADQSLADAQRAKYARLAAKIDLRAGDHVLEIGCGWGGFAIWAATTTGCRVTGITVSREQHALARRRVADAGLGDRVEIRLQDYRDVRGAFDKIVSIEMFEALGFSHWATFFGCCERVLAPDGLMALQTIAVPDHAFAAYRRHADWIQLYVFPGGELASLGALCREMTRQSRLGVHHLEDIGIHYAETLARWRARFLAAREQVRALGFDERFVRTWDYYLATCDALFRVRWLSDLQLVLTRPSNRVLPGIPAMRRQVA